MLGDRSGGYNEGLRSKERWERDIFRKIVKRVAYEVRVQDLFDELQAINGANERQQMAARELLPVSKALSRNKYPLRAGESKKRRKNNNAHPPQLKHPRAPDMSLR